MPVHYKERGPDDAPVLVMVHGAGGSSLTWLMQLQNLSQKLRCVALDLNGHGETPDRKEKDVTRSYLKDIAGIVKRYDSPVVMGHSMGGALTQIYALEHPDELKGIILVGTGCRLRVHPMIYDLLENDFEGYVDAAGRLMFHEATSDTVIQSSKEEIRKCDPKTIERDFDVCDCFDIMEKATGVKVPSLIIVGEDDQMTPVKYSDYMNERFPNSTMKVIPKAGHSVMLEQHEKFNAAILEWMKKERILQ